MKRMKSREVRDHWRETLRYVEDGGEVTVIHYNRPVVRIVPIEEPTMSATDKPVDNWYAKVPRPVTDEIAEQAFRAMTQSDTILMALHDVSTNEALTEDERKAAEVAMREVSRFAELVTREQVRRDGEIA